MTLTPIEVLPMRKNHSTAQNQLTQVKLETETKQRILEARDN